MDKNLNAVFLISLISTSLCLLSCDSNNSLEKADKTCDTAKYLNLANESEELHVKLSYVDSAIYCDQNNISHRHRKGFIQERMGLYDESVSTLFSALELCKNTQDSLLILDGLSLVITKSSRKSESLDLFDSRYGLDHDLPALHLNISGFYFNNDQYQDAITHLDSAISFSIDQSDRNMTAMLHANRALVYRKLGNMEACLADSLHAVELGFVGYKN